MRASLPAPLGDTRYELISGELFVAPQPDWNHQIVSGTVCAALGRWEQEAGCGVANRAPGIIFSPEDAVAPDVVWISHALLGASLAPDGKLRAAPELIGEVLAPESDRRDHELKPKLYGREGAEECWLIDWRDRAVSVYRRQGEQLVFVATLGDGDQLTSSLLPRFVCPISDLWRSLLD